MSPAITLLDPGDLLQRLMGGERPVVFMVGAPLTAPVARGKPGVPDVAGMIELVCRELGDGLTPGDYTSYQAATGKFLKRRGLDELGRLVRTAVLQAAVGAPDDLVRAARDGDEDPCRTLEHDPALWHLPPGVEFLGRLIADHPDRCGETVLTSNFDPLIEIAAARAGRPCLQTAVHGDGNLDQTRGPGCHVVHLHGGWYGTDTLHAPGQLAAERPQLRAWLRRLLERTTVVTVASGGWDDVFTRTVTEVVADAGAFPDLIWTFHTSDPATVRNARLLGNLRPGLDRGRVTLYGGVDCHVFFRELWERLRSAPPRMPASPRTKQLSPFVVGGAIDDDEDLFGRRAQRDLLRDAVTRGDPVQILGERRMGKTSLLRWVARHASEWRAWPTASINAQGLAGRSPAELVLAVAAELDCLAEARTWLCDADGKGTQAAGQVLDRLLPCVLLVDEASALAHPGHGFDGDFLGLLRAFGQDGRLVWISTSHLDLRRLFIDTGLTSSFLNDSRKVWVGQLEDDAARQLAARTDGPELTERIVAAAGGFAYGVQWLGDRLFRRPEDPDAAVDAFVDALEPDFEGWWHRRTDEDRTLLKQCVPGLERVDLTNGLRRRARRLAELGLLVEDRERERFVLPGSAWRSFVEGA